MTQTPSRSRTYTHTHTQLVQMHHDTPSQVQVHHDTASWHTKSKSHQVEMMIECESVWSWCNTTQERYDEWQHGLVGAEWNEAPWPRPQAEDTALRGLVIRCSLVVDACEWMIQVDGWHRSSSSSIHIRLDWIESTQLNSSQVESSQVKSSQVNK